MSSTTQSPKDEGVQRLDRRTAAALTIALLVVLFLAVNLIANTGLRHARLDLTENKLFTLSDGTLNIIRGLEEPVRLQLFYSEKTGADYPSIRTYAGRVRDLLQEYEARSRGKVILDVIEPEPFTDEEDLASAHGLTAAQTQGGESLFFGLVGTNAIDGKEIIPFFPQERAPFLEYDLTEMIHKLSTIKKPVLGLLSGLPLETGPGGIQAALQGLSRPMLIYEQLSERFQIESLEDDFYEVPDAVDVLLIAHPKPLGETSLYAIDQFVLRGGRALVFVDPQSNFSAPGGQPGQPGQVEQSSDLGPLLEHWGVLYDPSKVVADKGLAREVAAQVQGRQILLPYPIFVGVEQDNVAKDDLVTAEIGVLNLATSGYLEIKEDAPTEISPLITSSDQSMLLDSLEVSVQPPPEELIRKILPTGERYIMAARITGEVESAFPSGPPAREIPRGEVPPEEDADDPQAAHRPASDGPINVIVVADADLFQDRLWVQEQNFLGQRIAIPQADNANFVIGAVENLTGSNDLISLRTRASGTRPFTMVESIRRAAEQRYLTQEQLLVRELEATEARLAELQGQRNPTDADAVALLNPEQQALVDQFRSETIRIRRQLRDVQRSLRSEIETLGSWLAFINIGLIPLVLGGLAVMLTLGRQKKRAQRLRAGG